MKAESWELKLVRKLDLRDGIYLITPAVAQSLLDAGSGENDKNRPLRDFKSQKIGADIARGQWRCNGESLIFSDETPPLVLDGQHRLRGIVLANRPVEVLCTFGWPRQGFASLGQHTPRSGSDMAAQMKFANYSTVAAVARLALLYEMGRMTTTGPGKGIHNEDLKGYLSKNRQRLVTTVDVCVHHRAGLIRLLPLSHVGWVHYTVAPYTNGAGDEFVEKLATGAGLKKTDAVLLLRNRMLGLIGKKEEMRSTEKLALLAKAWNAFHAGKPISLLRWGQEETFPKLIYS